MVSEVFGADVYPFPDFGVLALCHALEVVGFWTDRAGHRSGLVCLGFPAVAAEAVVSRAAETDGLGIGISEDLARFVGEGALKLLAEEAAEVVEPEAALHVASEHHRLAEFP
jgi:hypothetical protein